MRFTATTPAWIVAAALGLCGLSGSVAGADFAEVVRPFLNRYCVDCHSSSDPAGDVAFDRLKGEADTPAEAALWLKMLEQLQAELMPPLAEDPPPRADRVATIQWIEQMLQDSGLGEAYRRKLLLPSYGNWVDHDSLFRGDISAAAYSPTRVWRNSPQIYAANHRGETANPFVFSTPDSGLRDYAATSSVDQSTIETVIMTTRRKLEGEIFRVVGGTRVVPGRRGPREITVRPNPRHRYAPLLSKEAPTQQQLTRLVVEEIEETLRRPPTEDEIKRYSKFLMENIKAGGQREALKATVLAIALCPEAIFRMELGLGPVDSHGRRRLSPDELVYALGYALDDRHPMQEEILTRSRDAGRLETREGVARTVRELLDRPDAVEGKGSAHLEYKWANARVLRFFRQYFGYHHAPKVFKDLQRRKREFNQRSPSTVMERDAVRDLDNLIHLILERDRNVFHELLTTDEFLIGHPGDNELMRLRHGEFIERVKSGEYSKSPAAKAIAAQAKRLLENDIVPYEAVSKQFAQVHLYNLPLTGENGLYWNFDVRQPVALPHRKGVLTHPAWLWSHSTNFDTDPIHRGIWVYTRLLAGVLADVPPDVDARVPDDPHKTLRERLDLVRDEACWKCHRKINPLGETFEIFDDWGRHREHFYFDLNPDGGTGDGDAPVLMVRRDSEFERKLKAGQLAKRPIDASGTLTGTGNPNLDGEVQDALELIDRLAQSDRARQSFIRHAFRYFLGRNETLRDSQTLIEADRAYLESGGSFKALVVSLLTSDSFLYRK